MKLFQSKVIKLCLVTIIIGIAAGLSGMLLGLLLHEVQHYAFGYSTHLVISTENFLEGIRACPPERRFIVLIICGLIAGLGWWMIYHFGKPLVSIDHAVHSQNPKMPFLTTTAHTILQMITVALGSPLGREVAPRELAAAFTTWFTKKLNLDRQTRQIMVACAAGAGLAAVYNVPFAGALFTLEVLLCSLNWRAILPAFATSTLATLISWIGLGNTIQYKIPDYSLNYSLMLWAVITSPIFGVLGYWFHRLCREASAKASHQSSLILSCLLNFMIIGALSIYFPELLGNGKGPAQIGFDNSVSIGLASILLLLRLIIVWTSFRSGAAGGMLTPSVANGALLGLVLGGVWNYFLPAVVPMGAFGIIGACAFLAASQKMPITAIIIMIEFTHVKFDFFIPMIIAVTGAIALCSICNNHAKIEA